MDEIQFIEQLKTKGIILTDKQIQQFHQYYKILIEWNQKMNLTAITKKEEVYLKHFYDSISVAFDFSFSNQFIIDVGAGAGFPSIPLKIIYPDLQITIIDSLNKRIQFLQHLFQELKLDHCKAIAIRAEDFAKTNRETSDIVMARAVARLNILDELCLPLVKINGYFIALKGKKAKEEMQEAKNGIIKLGGKLEKEVGFTLSNENDYRYNFFIKKSKVTPKQYPRNYSQIKKKPL
jgi:16S rRNA (guanine(527)-N(7))-methyltransferase GidB